MPRKRRLPIARKLRDVLTMGQVQELLWGCFAEVRNFESEADRRRAWAEHGPELLARTRPGSRPSAFWRYDVGEGPRIVREGRIMASEKHPEGYPVKIAEHETEALARLGLATDQDLAALRQDVDFGEREPALCRYSTEDLARMRALLASGGA